MNVAELKEFLNACPDNTPVLLAWMDNWEEDNFSHLESKHLVIKRVGAWMANGRDKEAVTGLVINPRELEMDD